MRIRHQKLFLYFVISNRRIAGQHNSNIYNFLNQICFSCNYSSQQPISSTQIQNVEKWKYVLAMFPYPSGRLHMGHLRVYTLSDVLARYYALKGHNVLHPIGWDAFGLPAENAAIERGMDSAEWTYKNVEEMRIQLAKTGVKFDWSRELFTCRPDYFRWTQWIFLQLHQNGLVRKAYSEVNWDPIDKTVLANEQVDANGRSWRSGAMVEKRRLNQWEVDICQYAKRLVDCLESLEFEWQEVAAIQKNLIGPCDVFRFLLPIQNNSSQNSHPNDRLDLRIVDPKQFCTAKFVLLTQDHQITREAIKQGLLDLDRANGSDFIPLNHLSVTNFVTGRPMPLVVQLKNVVDSIEENNQNPEFLMDSRLASNSYSPIERTICEQLGIEPPKKIQKMKADEIRKLAKTSRILRDWVVSRQRAWGTPIPMLVDSEEKGNVVAPIPFDQLPVLAERRGQRMPMPSFPSGWGYVERDTLDTYFDSSWYFLRFLDPHNTKMVFDPSIAHRQMPVDVYVGGVEHAQMHLLYSRFICHFLHSIGLIPHPEPFDRFIPLGVVRSRSYQLKSTGKYVPMEEVDGDPRLPNAHLVHRPSGEIVCSQFEKMSKSKHNGVDPLEIINEFGVDLTRLQLIFEARPNHEINWPYPYPTFQLKSLKRWMNKLEELVKNYIEQKMNRKNDKSIEIDTQMENKLKEIYNWHVKSVSRYLEVLRFHNMALIRLMDMTKAVRKCAQNAKFGIGNSPEFGRCLRALIIMMQVFASEKAVEHWKALEQIGANGDGKALEIQRWPPLDPVDTVDILVVVYATIFSKQAPRCEVNGLDADGLKQYARKQSHPLFFGQLAANKLEIVSTSVEKLDGIGIVVNLRMADNVRKSKITEIIRKYGGEGNELKRKEEKNARIALR